MDLTVQMETLKLQRQLFHSEADFQFALAWEIQKAYPGANIRLEYCPSEYPAMHIDIAVFMNSKFYPIELKYKTLDLIHSEPGESFHIKTHGAQDIGRYDCLKDIERVELLSRSVDGFGSGFAIILSNDPSYWSLPKSNTPTAFDQLRIHQGLVKTGSCGWGHTAGTGTTKNRERSIELTGKYFINWTDFSRLGHNKNGVFKYTLVKIHRSCNRDGKPKVSPAAIH